MLFKFACLLLQTIQQTGSEKIIISNKVAISQMKKKCLIILVLLFHCTFLKAQQTIIQYLSGTDKDHTVQWDFMCSSGMNSGKWSTIAVPSCWEQQGFGTFNYYQDTDNPDEQGWYKHAFKTAPSWHNNKIFIVFEGSMTDTEVKIDGKLAGPIHQGAFYQFRYDITGLLKNGSEHLLEVNVRKKSANNSVNRAERQADFWLFGGIFRPVFLEIVPETFIQRVAVDAKANGTFGMQVFTKNTHQNQWVEIQVQELSGRLVGKPFRVSAADSNYLQHKFTGIRRWNPEQPNLYQALISIKEGEKAIHTIRQRFGFRTVEFRQQDGFYVNDVRIVMKGVCRHSQWPESGRTLSRAVHLMDIGLIKDMNMNAVRMSHYPPDREFLDLCDSLGLFVLDELTGWQKAYDTIVGRKLVKEMVLRDVNHPSIIIWDNGNEGGWNRALDSDYTWYDPQQRFVMHPWEKFNGTETKHYPDFNYVTNAVLYGNEVFYPTEFMHGLFDGGHGAGLDDFWNEMMKHRAFAGGFLWSLHDEGVVRTDKKDSIDIAGNSAPDGIVGPHREKEASYYTIKEIWSPVQVLNKSIPLHFDGKIAIENRYLYTNLSQCKFDWKLVSFAKGADANTNEKIIQKGSIPSPDIAPGEKGWVRINPSLNTTADALYFIVSDAKGNTIITKSWALRQAEEISKIASLVAKKSIPFATNAGGTLQISCDGLAYSFDSGTGFLKYVFNGKKPISFGSGPALAGVKLTLTGLKDYKLGDRYIVEPLYGETRFYVKWIFESGQLPKLEYSYSQREPADFMGITFNYPEEKINGMKWMGRGPYRVWKNRMKGQQFGVWEKMYNNTVTGESWNYPEFKGWHSEMYWVRLQNKEADFTVYTSHQDIFLEMLQPEKPKGAKNENTSPPFPAGNIGFMHAISAIGTKFQAAALMGPQSQKNMQMNYVPIVGMLYFDFR
ncbi:MAG: glycoside hydrolase family 2 [Ferruginibacter sp.]|nr:glycoside hydrolase family 2 [Ferruginibacter sp.]